MAAPDELSRETQSGRDGSPRVDERHQKSSLDGVTFHQTTILTKGLLPMQRPCRVRGPGGLLVCGQVRHSAAL
jgi:hypothetical protein